MSNEPYPCTCELCCPVAPSLMDAEFVTTDTENSGKTRIIDATIPQEKTVAKSRFQVVIPLRSALN